jgi:hypothetical protein
MAIGRDGQRSGKLATRRAVCETYLLNSAAAPRHQKQAAQADAIDRKADPGVEVSWR